VNGDRKRWDVQFPAGPDCSTAEAYAAWLAAWFNINSPGENAILIGESLWERRR
jgi:hypothetical protein